MRLRASTMRVQAVARAPRRGRPEANGRPCPAPCHVDGGSAPNGELARTSSGATVKKKGAGCSAPNVSVRRPSAASEWVIVGG